MEIEDTAIASFARPDAPRYPKFVVTWKEGHYTFFCATVLDEMLDETDDDPGKQNFQGIRSLAEGKYPDRKTDKTT